VKIFRLEQDGGGGGGGGGGVLEEVHAWSLSRRGVVVELLRQILEILPDEDEEPIMHHTSSAHAPIKRRRGQ
jgi:spermidine synthase